MSNGARPRKVGRRHLLISSCADRCADFSAPLSNDARRRSYGVPHLPRGLPARGAGGADAVPP
eukprot:3995879-Pyramimonas_sp.AAC.1